MIVVTGFRENIESQIVKRMIEAKHLDDNGISGISSMMVPVLLLYAVIVVVMAATLRIFQIRIYIIFGFACVFRFQSIDLSCRYSSLGWACVSIHASVTKRNFAFNLDFFLCS